MVAVAVVQLPDMVPAYSLKYWYARLLATALVRASVLSFRI